MACNYKTTKPLLIQDVQFFANESEANLLIKQTD